MVRPGVRPAVLAALASFGVMVSVMNLSGDVVVGLHHHAPGDVVRIIGVHVLGMYALVLAIGTVIDRIGRPLALACGLPVLAALMLGLLWIEGVAATAVLLFGLGVGWNLSFVAATAEMVAAAAPSAARPPAGFRRPGLGSARRRLVVLGGHVLDSIGVAALGLGATAIVAALVLWLAPRTVTRAAVASRR